MKKILSLVLVTFGLAAAMAQTTVNEYPLPKGFNMMSAEETQVLGEAGGEVLAVVQPARGIITTYQDYEVQAIGKNGALRTVVLPDTRNSRLLAATLADGQVHVLLLSGDNNEYAIRRAVVNAATLQVAVAPTPMYRTTVAKSDLPYYKAAQSANGDFVAVLYGVYRNASKDFQIQEILLDNTLQELWAKKYPLGAVDEMMVSDEGEMLTLSYYLDSKSGRTALRFGRLDEEGETVQEASLDKPMAYVDLLNCVHGKFVMSGLLLDDPERRSNAQFSGFCGMVYDMRSRKLTQNTHLFTEEEVNVLENKKLNFGRKRNTLTAGMTPMSTAATAFGGAIAMSRLYSVTTTGNTAANGTEYFMTGTLVAAIDTNAVIVWSKPFRNFLKEPEHRWFFHNNLCAEGSTVYLVQSEPAKNSPAYDIASTAKMKAINGFKARTAVYAISPRGEVSKSMYGEASKQKVVTDLMPAGNGTWWFLTSMINHSTLNHVTIK